MEFIFLDDFLQSHNHKLDRNIFDILTQNYPLMKKDIVGQVDNKTFYYLHIDEANWSNNVIVED